MSSSSATTLQAASKNKSNKNNSTSNLAPKLTFTSISREESASLPSAWNHCVHVMLYADLPNATNLFNNKENPIKHTILVCISYIISTYFCIISEYLPWG